MPQHSSWSRLRLTVVTLTMLFTLTACIDTLTSSTSSSGNVVLGFIDGGATISGSVVDGPVIAATVTVRDANGTLLATTTSDTKANYTVHIPDRAPLPLTVTATGGFNLVTLAPPSFELVSVVMTPDDTTVNVNPFTTLIVKTARARPGGLTYSNLVIATETVLDNFNAGLDTVMMPDPITTPVTNQNVATLVKSSEVLAEIIRRSHHALNATGLAISEDALIAAMAGDMIDGNLDGHGAPAANPRLARTVHVTTAQVLIEALSNNLVVSDIPVADLLDTAISNVMPTSRIRTSDLPANAVVLRNTRTALDTAILIAPDTDMSELDAGLNAIRSGAMPATIAKSLPADSGMVLNSVITLAASGATAPDQDEVNEEPEIPASNPDNSSGEPQDPPGDSNDPPVDNEIPPNDGASPAPEPVANVVLTLTWEPNPGTVDGYIVYFGPSANAVNEETTDIKAFAGSFDPDSPLIRYDSWFDLGLSPGDQACFKLRAYNSSGISDWSSPVCGVIPQPA